MTKGQTMVRVTNEVTVINEIKMKFASIIDWLEEHRKSDGADQRLISIAQTELENSCMWVVKAFQPCE